MTKRQPRKLSDEIRQAIETCGKTRYRIAKQTGVDAATLCRFVQGQQGLSMDSLDRIAAYIGLRAELKDRSAKSKRER